MDLLGNILFGVVGGWCLVTIHLSSGRSAPVINWQQAGKAMVIILTGLVGFPLCAALFGGAIAGLTTLAGIAFGGWIRAEFARRLRIKYHYNH